ncbi:MAG: phosphoribosylaminoimidazolesuccinocarboxamide synthase [Negativicutes bacterium]|jgi:phosphoribosylaminoimidazole-succinocarboxamide synthase|nr:phosphoribosylaminoimidazolesuccinocarboxamide synthase [Negativicutes bacterium]MBP9536937.1 phosphoribosylaminoimidazolesuccinocarboxamide synthase [Negativicutes bacterium]MBP9949148.1 phosphoribosylaminoimidazolesuccinocarboxamide synthase [Negativicutes bacterium]
MKKEMLYEGKAKQIFATDNQDEVLVYYKDDATAGNGAKKGTILNKGIMNNKISSFFFKLLKENGVESHFIDMPSDREMLVKSLEIIQVEVVTRNIAAGSLAKRLGWAEGTKLPNTVVELYYKNDDLGDPIINDFHVAALNLATPEQVAEMESIALKVNEVLTQYLKTKDIELIDFKLEFGLHKGMVLLGDEISPDTCRFWDSKTGEKLDKDRFRRDLGNIEDAYKEVLHRLTGEVIC